jgi:hypothetical protein
MCRHDTAGTLGWSVVVTKLMLTPTCRGEHLPQHGNARFCQGGVLRWSEPSAIHQVCELVGPLGAARDAKNTCLCSPDYIELPTFCVLGRRDNQLPQEAARGLSTAQSYMNPICMDH